MIDTLKMLVLFSPVIASYITSRYVCEILKYLQIIVDMECIYAYNTNMETKMCKQQKNTCK